MITCLGKSCSFGLLCVFFEGVCQLLHVSSSFPFGIESRMWPVIVLIPDHCLSIYKCCILSVWPTLKILSHFFQKFWVRIRLEADFIHTVNWVNRGRGFGSIKTGLSPPPSPQIMYYRPF